MSSVPNRLIGSESSVPKKCSREGKRPQSLYSAPCTKKRISFLWLRSSRYTSAPVSMS